MKFTVGNKYRLFNHVYILCEGEYVYNFTPWILRGVKPIMNNGFYFEEIDGNDQIEFHKGKEFVQGEVK